ncbi:MAG: rane protein [Mucilaginibacter sp.]|nr:rane protein [Mucilaginibacter sp.]
MKNSTIKTAVQIGHHGERNVIIKFSYWVTKLNLPFMVISAGIIVMLLWAGSYKMTPPGAEGIVPLVDNSPLISWHFKLFGVYHGSDMIGLTEVIAAVLIITGMFKPQAGIIGGAIAVVMFFVTSTMVITTPGALTNVNGMNYMSFLGLFLFKDVINLGASLYLVSQFGHKAVLAQNNTK